MHFSYKLFIPGLLLNESQVNSSGYFRGVHERNRANVGILTATNGKEAVEAFMSRPVDLVLLDYHMPQMNGDVAARRMKACEANVPIALLSADVMPLSGRDAVDIFVSKSEPIPRVLEIVDELLSRRVLFQPLSHWAGGEKAA